MEGRWSYCPKCGARRGADTFDSFGRDLFSQLFGKMRSSFDDRGEFNRVFEKDMEAMDLSPWFAQRKQDRERMFKPTRGKGFSVRITRGTGMRPRVSVRTYGDVKKENIERVLQESSGVEKARIKKPMKPVNDQQGRRFRLPSLMKKTGPKCMEEPEAEVRRIGDKVIVEIFMPGVKSAENVEIKDLQSSVEVKAIARDRAYFKILTKPARFMLSQKSFKDGTLHLEFS